MVLVFPNRSTASSREFELLLVGGGLQNALIALAVLERRPDASLALIEASPGIGGNHTWCFHAGDVPAAARGFIDPLVVERWPGYDVAFPDYERHLAEPYAAISSERLSSVVTERILHAPNAVLLTGARVTELAPRSVTLSSGRRLNGKLVIDARGPRRFAPEAKSSPKPATGYQKFVGLELELEPGKPLARSVPLLMDTLVPQLDGLRFFYVLPLSGDRVLVEDTYFSDSAALDVPALRAQILAYAERTGFAVRSVVREEQGVLPLPTRTLTPVNAASPLKAGYGGGFFHPATGYSFPAALRLALHVSRHEPDALFGDAWRELVREHQRQFRFAAFLNRLLFTVFAPADRWHALSRFYRQPEATIRRFYSLDTSAVDRLRLLCGTPPSGLSFRAALSRGAFA